MRRDPVNGLYYPYYEVIVEDWVEDKTRENGGDYYPHSILATQSKKEAIAVFDAVEVSADRLEAKLIEDLGDDIVKLATKTACEDGPYVEWIN